MYYAPTLLHPTAYASRLAEVARTEYEQFKDMHESNPMMRHHIRMYWQSLQLAFYGTSHPWGAVFVSYCVKKAGASPEEFHFSGTHTGFVSRAVRAAERNDSPFQAYPVYARPVEVGDILVQRMPGTHATFEDAKTNPHLPAVSSIVTDVEEHDDGRYAMVVRGGVDGTIARYAVRLDQDGHIESYEAEDYICVIKNLK